MKQFFLLAIAAATVFTSCKKEHPADHGGVFKGPEVKVHHGKAWTWIRLNNAGNPEALAVVLNNDALNSVPVGNGHNHPGGHDHSGMENNFILKFHPKAAVIPFNHVGMGWNPHGHEPEHIYGIPHFDFHFYMMSPAEVAAIPPYELDSLKFKNWPTSAYFPPTYINPGGGVPQMGTHWLDVTSGELNGKPFTQTFIYGSYNGKVTFYEPMITLQFLKTNNNFVRDIPQPSKVQKSGWYPTKMKVEKQEGITQVILEGFVYRVQS